MKTTSGSIGIVTVFLLLGRAVAHLGFRGEHISYGFYIAGESADRAKDNLRELLDKFPDDQQLNLTRKLDTIPSHLESSSNASHVFASMVENFFNVAKNESGQLLLKLRQLPSEETISGKIKDQLTDYFSEMENFHVILCGILDDATEFTLDSVEMVQSTFLQYTDVHNDIIERRKYQGNDWCRDRYNEFLWHSADVVFQCANGKMHITYDVYAITKMITYHILKMLEHRIQKLFNCFLFGNYPIRCRFVRNPEADFEKLHARLDELQMYNEKQKRKIYRKRHGGEIVKCIPENFPDSQLSDSIKSCFQFSQYVVQ